MNEIKLNYPENVEIGTVIIMDDTADIYVVERSLPLSWLSGGTQSGFLITASQAKNGYVK